MSYLDTDVARLQEQLRKQCEVMRSHGQKLWETTGPLHLMAGAKSAAMNQHRDDLFAAMQTTMSFFSVLKKERTKRRIYPTRATAASDVFDYIEMFYNPIRRHGSAGGLSPVEFERRYAQSGVRVSTKGWPVHTEKRHWQQLAMMKQERLLVHSLT